MLEFTLTFLPLMAFVTVTANMGWAVYSKSTLQRAVRMGVRSGVTLTSGQLASGKCLTETVQEEVQKNALGLLNGTSGLAKIKVRFFQPPAVSETDPALDVTGTKTGHWPGNIMEVSVENYSLVPIVPRIFINKIEQNPMIVTVSSADRIEPSRNIPCQKCGLGF